MQPGQHEVAVLGSDLRDHLHGLRPRDELHLGLARRVEEPRVRARPEAVGAAHRHAVHDSDAGGAGRLRESRRVRDHPFARDLGELGEDRPLPEHALLALLGDERGVGGTDEFPQVGGHGRDCI